MARLSPETYKPLLQFRFQLSFQGMPDVSVYGFSATLPSLDNNPQKIDYANTYFKVKGKTTWNDITITCYAFEGLTMEELFQYLNRDHQEISTGKDKYADRYKYDMTIQLTSPSTNSVVGSWKLIGAFIGSINFGELSWATDDIIKPEITICYDYAEYTSKYINQTDTSTGGG